MSTLQFIILITLLSLNWLSSLWPIVDGIWQRRIEVRDLELAEIAQKAASGETQRERCKLGDHTWDRWREGNTFNIYSGTTKEREQMKASGMFVEKRQSYTRTCEFCGDSESKQVKIGG